MSYERAEKAKNFLAGLLPNASIESLRSAAELPAMERVPEEHRGVVESAGRKLSHGEVLNPAEQFAVEAIIIPDKRPAIDIISGDYNVVHPLWTKLNAAAVKAVLRPTFASIGRIELPGNPTLPYGGTGFVVGSGLVMTNRHVAEIFCSGLGVTGLVFRPGYRAGIDFLQEKGSTASQFLNVRDVLMIHPYWDMALLRVDGLDPQHPPLILSHGSVENILRHDIAVVGYPAFDPRNDASVQNTVFGGVYNIKRLQPGKLNAKGSVDSFGKNVSAATHDSSTLGGNSGSAVIDPASGQVVGLHFAGLYLQANYAVPTAELARDPRVVDAGVNFKPAAAPEAGIWNDWWNKAKLAAGTTEVQSVGNIGSAGAQAQAVSPLSNATPSTVRRLGQSTTWKIPVEITVRVGDAVGTAPESLRQGAGHAASPTKAKPVRDESALSRGPLTFRDHFLSLYQSAAAEVAKNAATSASNESVTADPGAQVMLAAERVAQASANDRTVSHSGAESPREESMALEKMSLSDHAQTCAGFGLQLLQAKILGDAATEKRLKAQLLGSTCDPQWITTIERYTEYFGPFGIRREPIYVTPEQAGKAVIQIPAGAKVALIGDWGTGALPARQVLERVKALQPDVLVHLGDIYYSGTDEECRANFEAIVNDVFDRQRTKLPVYTLCGNHDMYCGGVGYYALIRRLNEGAKKQPASFFCLRTEDESWQLLAMDTGRHDYSPLSVTDALTFIEPAEEQWLRERVREFDGKTILLSHHQLFSAFSQIGKPAANGKLQAYNPRLQATFEQLIGTGKSIPAWFWGHEHNLCIYEPYSKLEKGRCIGHSAIPVFVDDTPYDPLCGLDNPPSIKPNSMLSVVDQFYTHGFAMLALTRGMATADYYEDTNAPSRRIFTETIS
jgi:Trypsin-like peptidase domain/Calcineurin-like phosphoesterase